MTFSLKTIFSRKNMNLVVGLLSLFIALWIVMYAIPSIFVNLFDTFLGNLILVAFIVLAGMKNKEMGVGLAVVFFVLYRFSHMSMRFGWEGMSSMEGKKPVPRAMTGMEGRVLRPFSGMEGMSGKKPSPAESTRR